MEYPVITLRNAQKLMSVTPTFEEGSNVDLTQFVEYRGSGSSIEDTLKNLEDEIVSLISQSNAIRPTIDCQLRPMIHAHLCNLDEEVLGDRDFWRYLSSIRFRNLVSSRHPKSNKSAAADGLDANLNNFGALREDVKESLFFRLYLGAELAYDPANRKDHYHLSRVHDVDLWQSHIIRVLSGDNSIYVKGLVEWFRDRSSWYQEVAKTPAIKKSMLKYSDGLETRHLRDLVKRIRRLRSNIVHEYLNEGEIKEIIQIESRRSIENISSWGKEKLVRPAQTRSRKVSATAKKR